MPVKSKADIYKALGEVTRLRIVSLLLNSELCVCELESILDLSQSNVSRHLNKLSSAEILTCYKKSQWVYYSIDKNFSKENRDLISHIKRTVPSDESLKSDLERFEIYRKSGLSCDELKLKKYKLFK